MNFIKGVLENQVFVAAFFGWLIAQLIKVFSTLFTEKRINISRMIGSGGMPSSHSSFVMAMSTAVGLIDGWNSSAYGISLVFSLIVMYDASGVRRAVGKQAIILNQMVDDMYENKPFDEKRLKELIGHTPVEVFAGAILGIVIANMMIK